MASMKKAKNNSKKNDNTQECKLMRQLEDACKIAHNAGEPTYRFDVDEKVCYGAWQNVSVKEVLLDGTAYRVACSSVRIKHGKETEETDEQIVPWLSLRPLIPAEERTSCFSTNDDIRLSYSNLTIESLLSRHYHSGVNFEPFYQREYVWTGKDRELLLESIFMGADIGRFVFKQVSDAEWLKNQAVSYEIIDGKQRMLTLLSYYENRWAYKGVYFNQLSNGDRRKLLDTMTALAEVRNLSEGDTLRLFIRLNRSGRPVSDEIIKHAVSMLETNEQ